MRASFPSGGSMNPYPFENMIDQILALLHKQPLDGYEIFVVESSHFEVESKEGKVDTLQVSQPWGMSLRILNKGRIGFAYATSLSGSPQTETGNLLERMVEDAFASSEVTSSDPCYDFAPPLNAGLPELSIFDEMLREIPEKRKIETARLLEEAARSVDREKITKVRRASYQEGVSRVRLINSNGFDSSYATTYVTVSVMAVAETKGESEVGWDFDFSHFFNKIDVQKTGRDAGKKALDRLGGRRIPSGVYPILLENHVASEFLALLTHAFLSEQVQKGKSALQGKIGAQFFSPHLSLVDDGLLLQGAGSCPFDGEGTPSQRTPLVVEGEVRAFLYDRFWANRQKDASSLPQAQSTGNCIRHSIKAPPSLGISNFYIQPGKSDFSSMLKHLNRGVLIEEVMGMHTVDPISGDFSLGCSGQWIEEGKKVYPVKSIAIAGNLYQLFKRISEVGKDIRFFGKVGAPSLLIEGLEISGQ